MSKAAVNFRVKIPFRLEKSESVFTVGGCREFGDWNPHCAIKLTRWSIECSEEYWIGQAFLPVAYSTVQHRYFIAILSDGNDESHDSRNILISSWESHFYPRVLDVLSNMRGIVSNDVYGNFDGHYRVQRGWLTHQSEIQIRFHGDVLKWYKFRYRKQGQRYNFLVRYYTVDTNSLGHTLDSRFDDDDQCYEEPTPREQRTNSLRNSLLMASEERYSLDEDDECVEWYFAKASKLTLGGDDFPRPQMPEYNPQNGVVGVEYDPSEDYLTFHIQCMDIEKLSVEIEIWAIRKGVTSESTEHKNAANGNCDSSQETPLTSYATLCSSDLVQRQSSRTPFGERVAFARLSSLTHNSRFQQSLYIYGYKNNMPVGSLKVDCLVIRPLLGHEMSMKETYFLHWKHRNKTLDVGHRGVGTSMGTKATRVELIRENTIQSFRAAAEHGADYAELDVHLSKDKHAVVYHDFKVITCLRKKLGGDLQYMAIPVKDLTLADLQSLKLEDHHVMNLEDHTNELIKRDDDDPVENQPFPTLQQCLECVESELGYNIEIKYPQDLHDGTQEMDSYFHMNEFVDLILNVVFRYAKTRRIIFSCFVPDICVMLALKQNKYPVIFLTLGQTKRFSHYKDIRTRSTLMAIRFARSVRLLGICANTEEVLENKSLLDEVRSQKLILFVWGADLENKDSADFFKNFGVHGIIHDQIDKKNVCGTPNIFKLESMERAKTHNSIEPMQSS